MPRTLSEILKEADITKDLQGLIKLWNEIANDKYSYPLSEIYFASEYIADLALNSVGCDLEKGKFYLVLNGIIKN